MIPPPSSDCQENSNPPCIQQAFIERLLCTGTVLGVGDIAVNNVSDLVKYSLTMERVNNQVIASIHEITPVTGVTRRAGQYHEDHPTLDPTSSAGQGGLPLGRGS